MFSLSKKVTVLMAGDQEIVDGEPTAAPSSVDAETPETRRSDAGRESVHVGADSLRGVLDDLVVGGGGE